MPVLVLLTVAGSQVPVIPLVDVAGKTGAGSFAHIDILLPKLKVGGIIGFTCWV